MSGLKKFVQQQLSPFFKNGSVPEVTAEIAELFSVLWEWEQNGHGRLRRVKSSDNPLFREGRYQLPIINQWVTGHLDRICDSQYELWPQRKQFAVCLSHDADNVAYGSLLARSSQCLKILGAALRNPREVKQWLVTVLNRKIHMTAPVDLHPADTGYVRRADNDLFTPWLELESQYGWRSTFFFFPDKISRYNPFDGKIYRYSDKIRFAGQTINVATLMQELDRRGWEIGLHGTYNSFDDADELKKQKAQIEKVLQKEIVSIRQHTLRFDIRRTPRAQRQAGFKYDSTFGSNRLVGFRNGAACPFYFYDLEADRRLPLLEIPLHIQDGALLSPAGMNLTPRQALEVSKQLIERVEKSRGLITLLWHPHTVVEERFPGWFWVYEQLLEFIHQKGAWVTTVAEAGQWWEKQIRKNAETVK